MPGFLTHYLAGMETCEKMSDNYICSLIRNNNHAFLVGLQGADLLAFNPHALSKRGLSYRTASGSGRSQEYAAFFNNMMEYIQTLQGSARDSCISYLSGYLCYYALGQTIDPFIQYRVWQLLPLKSNKFQSDSKHRETEALLDTILLRSKRHMEPSQLNFQALTFVNKKELEAISLMLRYSIQATYKYRISLGEIAKGIRYARHEHVYLQPGDGIKGMIKKTAATMPSLPLYPRKIYEDFLTDDNDEMNTGHNPWFPYPGCTSSQSLSYEELFDRSVSACRMLLDALDSCLSWGMDNEEFIDMIMGLRPYD